MSVFVTPQTGGDSMSHGIPPWIDAEAEAIEAEHAEHIARQRNLLAGSRDRQPAQRRHL